MPAPRAGYLLFSRYCLAGNCWTRGSALNVLLASKVGSACPLEQVRAQYGSFAAKITAPLHNGALLIEIGTAAFQPVDEVPVGHQDLVVTRITKLELPVRVRSEGVLFPDPGQGPSVGQLRRSVQVRSEENSVWDSVQLADLCCSLPFERQTPARLLSGFVYL